MERLKRYLDNSKKSFNKVKAWFCNFDMTWKRVIIFAVITAVYTAIINLIPFLKNTSFQDIAISFECWILFAVFIIVNCKSRLEASLKCFVFFLISQPLIYLIEVPFNNLGWGLFQYYRYWFIVTILTLPGAAIAYQLKRKDWLSVPVLSVATGFLSYMSIYYLRDAISDFPHHILSSVFCLALALFLIFVFLDDKKHRLAALALVVAVLIASIIITGRGHSYKTTLDEGSWSYSIEDDSIAKVKIDDENNLIITAKHKGSTVLYLENTDGTERKFDVTVGGDKVWVDEILSE